MHRGVTLAYQSLEPIRLLPISAQLSRHSGVNYPGRDKHRIGCRYHSIHIDATAIELGVETKVIADQVMRATCLVEVKAGATSQSAGANERMNVMQ